jgi:hypothetical protein
MPRSRKLIRIADVHATFFMLIAWIAPVHWNESQNLARCSKAWDSSSHCVAASCSMSAVTR